MKQRQRKPHGRPRRRTQPAVASWTPPGHSRFIAPNGTESKHYADQLELFYTFDCRNEHLTPQQVNRAAISTEVLP